MELVNIMPTSFIPKNTQTNRLPPSGFGSQIRTNSPLILTFTMHSALYLSSALLLWPLFVSALPLPSCLNFDPSPGDGGDSCDLIEHNRYAWALEEGHLRRKARSAADGNAKPALEPRDDVVELAVAAAEGSVRRDAESPLSNVEKEKPTVDTRAGPTPKKRWIMQEKEELMELYSGTPGESTDGLINSTRLTLYQSRRCC